MTPHSSIASSFDHKRFSDKDKLKLRKPVIEKMRRDRINNCINQLKKLLEKELHSQDPSTRMEKADILEMTVNFLKEQKRIPSVLAQTDYNQGYSHCWRESLHFLSIHSRKGKTAQDLQLNQQIQSTSTGLSCSTSVPTSKHSHVAQQQSDMPVWRPW